MANQKIINLGFADEQIEFSTEVEVIEVDPRIQINLDNENNTVTVADAKSQITLDNEQSDVVVGTPTSTTELITGIRIGPAGKDGIGTKVIDTMAADIPLDELVIVPQSTGPDLVYRALSPQLGVTTSTDFTIESAWREVGYNAQLLEASYTTTLEEAHLREGEYDNFFPYRIGARVFDDNKHFKCIGTSQYSEYDTTTDYTGFNTVSFENELYAGIDTGIGETPKSDGSSSWGNPTGLGTPLYNPVFNTTDWVELHDSRTFLEDPTVGNWQTFSIGDWVYFDGKLYRYNSTSPLFTQGSTATTKPGVNTDWLWIQTGEDSTGSNLPDAPTNILTDTEQHYVIQVKDVDGVETTTLVIDKSIDELDDSRSYQITEFAAWNGELYECIIATSPGEDPTDTPSKWLQKTWAREEINNPRGSAFELFFGIRGDEGTDGGDGTEAFEVYTHAVYGTNYWFLNRNSGNGSWANAKLNTNQTIRFDLAGNNIS